MSLVFGLLVLVLVLWAAHFLAKADPKSLIRVVRPAGGIAALAGAAFLMTRGQVGLAIPLGAAGLGLLGWLPWPAGLGARTQRSPGQVSRVRSTYIEMELDHDTGAMRGQVLAGRHQGKALDAIEVAALIELLSEIDAESQALLAAYLDRRQPSWREHAQAHATAGQGGSVGSGKMTEQEAYQILGIQPGATAEEIGRAHRTLMKKLHPDQGGSTYLAARINEAKEVLLRRHR
jgi:DnaJ domain